MFCKLENKRNCTGYTWGAHQANFYNATKTNLIDDKTIHFGSKDEYYAFGNRGNYDLIDYLSISLYVLKKYNNGMRNSLANFNADILQKFLVISLASK